MEPQCLDCDYENQLKLLNSLDSPIVITKYPWIQNTLIIDEFQLDQKAE